jgi:hypothetical protein
VFLYKLIRRRMLLPEHQLTFGYWPSRQLAGQNPGPILYPRDYDGSDTVNLSCTQTNLSASEQRKLVKNWCSLLPQLPVKTILFSSKANQELFDAAVTNPGLESLFVKWSSVKSISALVRHPTLMAFYLGDSPSATGLGDLSSLPALRHLFVQGVQEAANLDFAARLHTLVEFGLSGGSRPLTVETLEPLAQMQSLAILWLVRIRPRSGALKPLHRLTQLQSFIDSFITYDTELTRNCSNFQCHLLRNSQ